MKNAVQDMAMYLHTMVTATTQQRRTQKPADGSDKSGEKRFQDLLTEKRPAAGSEQKPNAGQATEPVKKEETDLRSLQLLAAAQAAAAAIQTVDVITPQAEVVSGAVPVATIDPIQVNPQLQQMVTSETVEGELLGTDLAANAKQMQTEVVQTGSEHGTELKNVTQPEADAPVTQVQTEHQTRDSQSQLADGDEGDVELIQAQTGEVRTVFSKVDAAPIKVSDTAVVDTESGDMEAQLAGQVDQLLTKGGDRIELKLTPENLGTVTVELTRDQGGALHVVLSTTNRQAAELLEKHSSGLENLLASGSRNSTVQVEVQHPQEGQQSQNQQLPDREGRNGQQQQQQQQEQQKQGQDFMQQLRLGLFPLTAEE